MPRHAPALTALLAALLAAPASRAAAKDQVPAAAPEEGGRFLLPLSIGALFGLNLSSFVGQSDNSMVHTKDRAGFAGGVYLAWRLRYIGARVEAIASSKGTAFSQNQLDGSASIHYLEFPVLGSLFLPFSAVPLEARGAFGMSFGYRLGGDLRDSAGNHIDLNPATRDLEVGLIIGAGLAWLSAGHSALLLELRYQYGLLGIGHGSGEAGRVVGNDAHNSVLSILVGYEL
jgi:hypothetical protein